MKLSLLFILITLASIKMLAQVPTQTCPSSIDVSNDPGICGAAVNYTIPTCSSNCAGTTIYQSDLSGLTSGDVFPVGITQINYTITNGTDSSNCIFKIEVLDTESPVVNCNGNIDQYLDASCSFTVPNYALLGQVTATDNCGLDSISQTPTVGSILGTAESVHTITVRAYDNYGNIDSCSFDITLKDTIAPSITCPGTITEPTTSGCQAVLQNYIGLATVIDNCDSTPIITQSPVSGTGFTTSQDVTIYAEDMYGNIDSCTFTVVSDDIVAPSITCPNNTSEYVNSDCEFIIPDFTSLPVATDNCDPSLTITQNPLVGSKILGANTNHFISFQATDIAGNSSTCSFQITLLDTIAPEFVACSDTMVPLNHDCEYIVPNLVPYINPQENCSAFSSQQIPPAGTVIAGVATTQLIVIVDDAYGNSASCFMDIITIDTTSPNVASCPSDQSFSTGATDCNYTMTDFSPDVFAIDNCTSSLTITQSIPAGTLLPAGSVNTVTMTVTDDAGNFNTCDFDISVVDLVAPDLVCPVNPSVPMNSNCEFTIPSYDTVLNITDNCGIVNNYSQTPPAGTVLSGVGTQQSISIFIEDDNGNSNSCSFIITLADTTSPTLICPNNQSIAIDANCQYVIPDLSSQATFSDYCDTNPTFNQSPSAGTLVSGILTLNIVVTDASGNSNTCALQTQPDDQLAPTLTCPSDTASCNKVYSFNTPIGNDNCGIVTVNQTDASGLTSGDSFPTGTTTIEFTATDEVGNTSVCDFDVTVYPTPQISIIGSTTIDEKDSILLSTTIDSYDTLIWYPTYNLSNDTIQSPWASPNATTNYKLTVINSNGCLATDSVLVTVNQIEELIINNFISPNGDGKNEFWTMNKPSIISGCTVRIYDRWAKLVWETNSYENQWNGNNSADEPLPDGTYFYNIVCPGEEDVKGSILLIR